MLTVTLTLNPALDKSTTIEKLRPDSKLRCGPMQIDAGGGGINVSKGIKILNGDSIAVFPAGGANGAQLAALLHAANIKTDILEIPGETRENFSVTETSTNLQYRFTLPGIPMSEAQADSCLEKIALHRPDILVVSGSLPQGLPDSYYRKVAGFAKYIKAKLVLDTSGPPLKIASEEGAFLLKPNMGELCRLAGVEKLEMNQVDDAATMLIHQGICEVVLVSLGAQGALLATRDGFEHIPAPTVHKQTTVGAGDSMVAGMIWALSTGKNYREMAQTGVACGTASIMNKGTELFHLEDANRLLEWIKTYGDKYRITDF